MQSAGELSMLVVEPLEAQEKARVSVRSARGRFDRWIGPDEDEFRSSWVRSICRAIPGENSQLGARNPCFKEPCQVSRTEEGSIRNVTGE